MSLKKLKNYLKLKKLKIVKSFLIICKKILLDVQIQTQFTTFHFGTATQESKKIF
jgi:hypothetical protein